MTPGPDESAGILTGKIRNREPFFFVRYGDGALECIYNRGHGRTCDGEQYSGELGSALLDAWVSLVILGFIYRGRNVYVGDWLSASFDGPNDPSRYRDLYQKLVQDAEPDFLHFESLLLMRESEALVNFYRAVKQDPRKKMFMGPWWNRDAAKMLDADFLETPTKDLFAHVDVLARQLTSRKFDVLLYGAGMAGTIPAVKCWERFPERTYVNLGSAMDPLFYRRTRRQQLATGQARALFSDLL
jgi:hypothetical protein